MDCFFRLVIYFVVFVDNAHVFVLLFVNILVINSLYQFFFSLHFLILFIYLIIFSLHWIISCNIFNVVQIFFLNELLISNVHWFLIPFTNNVFFLGRLRATFCLIICCFFRHLSHRSNCSSIIGIPLSFLLIWIYFFYFNFCFFIILTTLWRTVLFIKESSRIIEYFVD
jgi:hypothetical protein